MVLAPQRKEETMKKEQKQLQEKDFKYFRCQVDHRIFTTRAIHAGEACGHPFRVAGYVTFWEWLKIKTGIIR